MGDSNSLLSASLLYIIFFFFSIMNFPPKGIDFFSISLRGIIKNEEKLLSSYIWPTCARDKSNRITCPRIRVEFKIQSNINEKVE